MYVLHITLYILISTDIIPQPYYLTQRILFILTEQSKYTERSMHISARSRHPGIQQNKKSYPMTKGTE